MLFRSDHINSSTKLFNISVKILTFPKQKIKDELKGLPDKVKIPKITSPLSIPEAKGCKECNFTGYRGRIGVFEAFKIDDEMEKFILEKPSIAALREKAVARGMVTMKQDGIIKVLEKKTTLEEVERVVGE